MSISRTAYLSLAALLAIAPAACGGDDDGDDGGGAADSGGGGQADAGGGEADAGGGEADAGDEADAAADSPYDHLIGLAVTAAAGPLMIETSIRLLATITVEGTTAEFTLQPVTSPDCDGPPGVLVGEPRTETAEVDAKGAFEITLAQATLPMGSVGGAGSATTCGVEIIGDLTVTGSLQANGEPCGAVTGTITSPLEGTAEGTFGSVAIKAGTIGEDLPAGLDDCEK
jgi:hypothetical protein